jgi:hypothetical protein
MIDLKTVSSSAHESIARARRLGHHDTKSTNGNRPAAALTESLAMVFSVHFRDKSVADGTV